MERTFQAERIATTKQRNIKYVGCLGTANYLVSLEQKHLVVVALIENRLKSSGKCQITKDLGCSVLEF